MILTIDEVPYHRLLRFKLLKALKDAKDNSLKVEGRVGGVAVVSDKYILTFYFQPNGVNRCLGNIYLHIRGVRYDNIKTCITIHDVLDSDIVSPLIKEVILFNLPLFNQP